MFRAALKMLKDLSDWRLESSISEIFYSPANIDFKLVFTKRKMFVLNLTQAHQYREINKQKVCSCAQ